MSRERTSSTSHRRHSMSDNNRDPGINDDYYHSRRRSRRDSRSSSSGYGSSTGSAGGGRRSSEYYGAADDPSSRTERAAYRTASISHNVTRTAGYGVEHIAARGQGAVDIVRGAVGELWDGLWGDKAGARKNFERVERGKHSVRYGRHAEPADVAVPRNSRGGISRVINEREKEEERRRSEADYKEGYTAGLNAAKASPTMEAVGAGAGAGAAGQGEEGVRVGQ